VKQEINVSWKDGMAFEAEVDGYKLMLDAGEKVGGRNLGPRPKPLMLVHLPVVLPWMLFQFSQK